MKPVVYFTAVGPLNVGQRAFVDPLNHPSALVSNKTTAYTSIVMKLDSDGGFETENTQYVPVTRSVSWGE